MGRRARATLWALVSASALTACDGGSPSVVLRTDDATVLATGAAVYQKHCAACHGARLEGQPLWRQRDAQGRMPAPPHDATGHTWHHPDQLLFDVLYDPWPTPLASAAHEAGAPVIGGLALLVRQAALQIEIWSGRSLADAAVGMMRAAGEAALRERAAGSAN